MANITLDWQDLVKPLTLPTGRQHRISIRRETIPIIVVPGIMGTRLKSAEKKPTKLWDPDAHLFMLGKFGMFWVSARDKQEIILGKTRQYVPGSAVPFEDDAKHNQKSFEVEFPGASERGWGGVSWATYAPILKALTNRDWGRAVSTCFRLPVYAVGFDWRGSAETAGQLLKKRVAVIKQTEIEQNHGQPCRRVILVTHSMGGLVARAACAEGLESEVLSMIHTVQPVDGAPAAYWRMKAGFERHKFFDFVPWVLGTNGLEVTALLGHMPGGCQLLPSATFRTDDGNPEWLTYAPNGGLGEGAKVPRRGNPYDEIYRNETDPWRLILIKDHLAGSRHANGAEVGSAWQDYLRCLRVAEAFHKKWSRYQHPKSWHFYGVGRPTAAAITIRRAMNMRATNKNDWGHPQPTTIFDRGEFVAFEPTTPQPNRPSPALTMSEPDGNGEGTVARSSARALVSAGKKNGFPINNTGHDSFFADSPQACSQIGDIIQSACGDLIRAERVAA